MLLCVPHTTAAAVAAWCSAELDWSGSMIATIMIKFPQLFGLSAADNLTPKLAWFVLQGCRKASLRRVFFSTPALLSYSIQRNNTQLIALQALGLPLSKASYLISRVPTLLTRKISGQITQAKIEFLTQVMHQQIEEICVCPRFLTYSLFERIGPRWSFHSRHCHQGRPYKLNTKLQPSDKHFSEHMGSPSLDAECTSRGMTHEEVYQEHKEQWQQGEGKIWNVRIGKSTSESQVVKFTE